MDDKKIRRIAASTPLNSTAASVVSKGYQYTPARKIEGKHSDFPLKIRPIPRGSVDLCGKKFGRFTVIGLHDDVEDRGNGKKYGSWVVRCSCGRYENRRSKAIHNPANSDDCCAICRHTMRLQRAGAWRSKNFARKGTHGEVPMRTLEGHKVNPANDRLVVIVADEPGHGGANHRYEVTGFDTNGNASAIDSTGYKSSFSKTIILFQNGPIGEAGVGVNGVTHEVLLEILADRLRGFQSGPYACRANADALQHIEEAQAILQARTKERMSRGVEGTHAQ